MGLGSWDLGYRRLPIAMAAEGDEPPVEVVAAVAKSPVAVAVAEDEPPVEIATGEA
jgi:hypothetical protein